MRRFSVVILGLALFSFLVSCAAVTRPFGHCDPIGNPNDRVAIEGAHIVSEGAYFRFWILNNLTNALNATINDAHILLIPPKSSIDYAVVAPQVSVPYQKVIYVFKFSFTSQAGEALFDKIDYPVLVLDSIFVQVFDLIIPFLIVGAIGLIILVSVIVLKRKRALSRASERTKTSATP